MCVGLFLLIATAPDRGLGAQILPFRRFDVWSNPPLRVASHMHRIDQHGQSTKASLDFHGSEPPRDRRGVLLDQPLLNNHRPQTGPL